MRYLWSCWFSSTTRPAHCRRPRCPESAERLPERGARFGFAAAGCLPAPAHHQLPEMDRNDRTDPWRRPTGAPLLGKPAPVPDLRILIRSVAWAMVVGEVLASSERMSGPLQEKGSARRSKPADGASSIHLGG